jgi:hypothetical protein
MNEPSQSVTLSEWARRREPQLHISAKSEPEPVLLAHNLVAAVHDPDASRELLRKWERIQPAAAGVGFVAMSSVPQADGRPSYEEPGPTRAEGDPQKVTGHAARRILRGAIPGGVIGAIVVGDTVVTYASIHSDDLELIRKAAKAADVPGGTMLSVDRTGRAIPLDETTNH